MKRRLAATLSAILIAGLLGACAEQSPSQTAASAPENSTSAEIPKEAVDEKLKIAILLPGLLGDKSFFDATNEAAPLLESELRAEVKVVEMGKDQTRWYPTFVDYCEQDYDLILTVSAPINDVLTEVSAEFPDQKFMNVACGAKYDVPENVYVMESNMGEMGYLAGIVAALKAKELDENKLGFIGGMDIPDINEFLIGYIDGAQYINADIKVAYSFVGDFADPSKAKENALVMYAEVPIIYQAAGGSGLGVFSAAKEMTEKGKQRFAIGVDSDQAMSLKNSDPETANLIITSTVKQISESTLEAVIKYTKGEIPFGKQELNGLKDKAISISKNEFYEKLLSTDNRKLVDEIEAKIVSGEIKPRISKGLPTEEVEQIRNAVRP
ncbi:MAG: BMP family ABC transporter substrate-binding protein [Hungatella sp.]|jgi:basic membrane protein A|nr:BMP family ABC transporter substrate-binding protein [Hungatella sp.]